MAAEKPEVLIISGPVTGNSREYLTEHPKYCKKHTEKHKSCLDTGHFNKYVAIFKNVFIAHTYGLWTKI